MYEYVCQCVCVWDRKRARERHFSLLISTGRSGYFASMAARVPREMRWGEPLLSESKLQPSLGQPLSITQHNNWASSNCLVQELDVTYSKGASHHCQPTSAGFLFSLFCSYSLSDFRWKQLKHIQHVPYIDTLYIWKHCTVILWQKT